MAKYLSCKSAIVCILVGCAVTLVFFSRKVAANGPVSSQASLTSRDIRFALSSLPEKLSVFKYADVSTFTILTSVHMGLVSEDYQGNLYSGVASSWSVSSSGRTYTFNLDRGLEFHSGMKLECGDVLATFQRLLKSGTQFSWSPNISKISCLSEDVFEVVLRHSSSAFLPALAGLEASILPASQGTELSTTVGLGPYHLSADGAPDGLPMLEKVTGHPLLKALSPDHVYFKLYEHMREAEQAFSAGLVDVVPRRAAMDAVSRESVVESLGYSRLWFLALGDKLAGTLSRSMRKCLSRSVDRRSLIATISNNVETMMSPAFGVVPPQTAGTLPDASDTAVRCVKPTNLHSVVELIYIEGQVGQAFLAELRRSLRTFGLQVRARRLAKSEFIARFQSRTFDAAVASFGLTIAPELNLRNFYGSKSLLNFTPKSTARYDQDIDAIERSASEQERAAKINMLEARVGDDPYLIPLTFQRMSYLANLCVDMESIRSRTLGEQFQDISVVRDCQTGSL
jgi:MarR-like DNA-binding transcriptional regulator SgrR of sgrS sRNA